MKRSILALGAIVGALALTEPALASWGSLHYGGYQPWWNIFARRNRNMSAEEERLQRFWHDYYDSLQRYYGDLDNIDWVAYYKNHGYQINSSGGGHGCGPCGGSQRVQFAPVFVSPNLQWAVPHSGLGSPPPGPPYPPPSAYTNIGMGQQPSYPSYPSYPGAPY